MDPLFSFQDNTGGFDFGAAFGSTWNNQQQQTTQHDSSATTSNNAWSSFQQQQNTNDVKPSNTAHNNNTNLMMTAGKPMFDLSSAISGFDAAPANAAANAQSNSLNQLLSQHLDAQQQAHQHHQSQLAALFSDDHLAPTPIRAPAALPSLTTTTQAAAPPASTNVPSMFVATLVDPNQEGATPQQMLFLPGTNQVIPMSGANEGQLLNLADMPVVFQNQVLGGTAANNTMMFQQQQQHQDSLAPTPLSALRMSHAQVTGGSPTMVVQPPKAQEKKPEANMPVRPLSAYNFFFSDERERILKGEEAPDTDVYDDAKKQRLLVAHLAKDRTKRRPHRKTHGKINFTTLSKLIGQRWRQLSDDRKNFYRQVAAIDLERYQRELRERGNQQAAGGI